MASLSFHILDVFAESKYAGNQLAVFRGGQDLSDRRMQQIAREMNFSETTFIMSEEEKKGGFDVRIFTPAEEVPFAGHPTLGTAFTIQHEIIREKIEKVVLNLKIGQIPVTFTYNGDKADILWMRQNEPVFGKTFEIEEIAAVLGLKIEDFDIGFPIQEVSTGLPFIIAPLVNMDAVKRARIKHDFYFELIKRIDSKAILLFSRETYDPGNNLNARMFADFYGVPEDPATGSANGCLAAYLVRHRYFGEDKIDIKVEQGYEIGRPSLLNLRASENDHKIEVNVGGRVVMVAKGEFV